MNKTKIKVEQIIVPKKIAVYEDKKTSVKTVAFPFSFPDGVNGIISVTKLDAEPWVPGDDLEAINLIFTK